MTDLKKLEDLVEIKSMIELCESKGLADAVRVLDQCEVMGTALGKACTMQVMDYITGEWMPCAPGGKHVNSLAYWYDLIRSELVWTDPIRLAIAAKG